MERPKVPLVWAQAVEEEERQVVLGPEVGMATTSVRLQAQARVMSFEACFLVAKASWTSEGDVQV